MTCKRAKTLSDDDIALALAHARACSAMPRRDELLILLTCFAGLRIQEACRLHESDFTDARGAFVDVLFVSGRGAKYGKARYVPLRREVKIALKDYMDNLSIIERTQIKRLGIFFSRNGSPLRANAGARQIKRIYTAIGLVGASSHSGRRTFGTRTARMFAQLGGTLMDTQLLLGHAHIDTTVAYIEPSPIAMKVVSAI